MLPGRAVWFGMIQWSMTLNATGWPATTPLTVTVTGKPAAMPVVSALTGANFPPAVTFVVVHRVDWQFTGETPPPAAEPDTAKAVAGTAPTTKTSPPATIHRCMTCLLAGRCHVLCLTGSRFLVLPGWPPKALIRAGPAGSTCPGFILCCRHVLHGRQGGHRLSLITAVIQASTR
jgi:hypothetical protein